MASKAVKEKDDHIIQNFIDKEPPSVRGYTNMEELKAALEQ